MLAGQWQWCWSLDCEARLGRAGPCPEAALGRMHGSARLWAWGLTHRLANQVQVIQAVLIHPVVEERKIRLSLDWGPEVISRELRK